MARSVAGIPREGLPREDPQAVYFPALSSLGQAYILLYILGTSSLCVIGATNLINRSENARLVVLCSRKLPVLGHLGLQVRSLKHSN